MAKLRPDRDPEGGIPSQVWEVIRRQLGEGRTSIGGDWLNPDNFQPHCSIGIFNMHPKQSLTSSQ